jgi:PIN domain nuclease of toxin-antitoxin system
LDTHALIWALGDPDRLSTRARELIEDGANELVVSAGSAWEIATKHRIGKLPGVDRLLGAWDDALRRLRAEAAPIDHGQALRAGAYDVAHRDPFDRLLAAHAELAAIPLVTVDTAFADFPVTTIW